MTKNGAIKLISAEKNKDKSNNSSMTNSLTNRSIQDYQSLTEANSTNTSGSNLLSIERSQAPAP